MWKEFFVKNTRRVVWIVLDSLGVGELPDAQDFSDAGAATLQHIKEVVGDLKLKNLVRLGLGRVVDALAGGSLPVGYWGKMAEKSLGKDTTTGHWEMSGLIQTEAFPVFPDGFPKEIVEPFVNATGRGVLGNKTASGTVILEELGAEHVGTGKWILYTSADSVFQLAAHEEVVGLDELYAACRQARKQLDAHRVGRVIARPFVGEPGSFHRTYNRHDFSLPPSGPTVLDALQKSGVPTIGVGKISDIFAGQGLDRSIGTRGNLDGIEKTMDLLNELSGGLLFVNLVDFDMLYGHRRDPRGYAEALEVFDAKLPEIMHLLHGDDVLILTADHGCDPTFSSHTDHTREYVPLLVWSKAFSNHGDLGIRETFADLAATVADAFGVAWPGPGQSFLGDMT
jgi:phosphopentomutase